MKARSRKESQFDSERNLHVYQKTLHQRTRILVARCARSSNARAPHFSSLAIARSSKCVFFVKTHLKMRAFVNPRTPTLHPGAASSVSPLPPRGPFRACSSSDSPGRPWASAAAVTRSARANKSLGFRWIFLPKHTASTDSHSRRSLRSLLECSCFAFLVARYRSLLEMR